MSDFSALLSLSSKQSEFKVLPGDGCGTAVKKPKKLIAKAETFIHKTFAEKSSNCQKLANEIKNKNNKCCNTQVSTYFTSFKWQKQEVCDMLYYYRTLTKAPPILMGRATTVDISVRTEIDPHRPHTYFWCIFSYTQVLYKQKGLYDYNKTWPIGNRLISSQNTSTLTGQWLSFFSPKWLALFCLLVSYLFFFFLNYQHTVFV